MSKKLIIDWNEYNRSIDELAVQISESGFKPTFIICIARGGLRVGDIPVSYTHLTLPTSDLV